MAKAAYLAAACAFSVAAASAAIGKLALAEPAHVPSAAGDARAAAGQAAVGGLSGAHPLLTVAECQGLGGKVNPSAKCGSTFTCVAVDQNGVVHTACITTDKH
jgi:hypothetical protein